MCETFIRVEYELLLLLFNFFEEHIVANGDMFIHFLLFCFLGGSFRSNRCESDCIPVEDGKRKRSATAAESNTLQQMLPDFTENFTDQFASP